MAEIVLSFYLKYPVPNQLEMHLGPVYMEWGTPV